MNETVVEVTRSDLIFLKRVLDYAFADLEAMVRDGDEDESVLIDLEDALYTVSEYLK